MSFDFSGKTVIITGASGHLGGAVAQGFAAAGASIALVDVDAERLQKVADALPHADRHQVFAADLTQPQPVTDALSAITAHFKTVDVLAHTVGGFAAGKPVHEAGISTLEQMIRLNVRPVYLMGGAVAQHMLDHKIAGKLIFVLAMAGKKGGKNRAAYTASKAAATRIMESMAEELKDAGINVNGVSPSTIDTPANRESMPDADFSKWVTPQQLTDAIQYLASDQSSALHGVNLEVAARV